MPKRFTDTAKWRKKFVKGLRANHKLLWFYILDDCDHAGIWHTDFEVASIRIGCPIDEAEALLQFTDHVVVFDEGENGSFHLLLTFNMVNSIQITGQTIPSFKF